LKFEVLWVARNIGIGTSDLPKGYFSVTLSSAHTRLRFWLMLGNPRSSSVLLPSA
jgi:hypothetical protein